MRNRKEFSLHTEIPVRTLEDWEAGRRTPPEYIPQLIEYQMKYEKLMISVLSAVAEIERENIRTQTMTGREQKAKEGKWKNSFLCIVL